MKEYVLTLPGINPRSVSRLAPNIVTMFTANIRVGAFHENLPYVANIDKQPTKQYYPASIRCYATAFP
jgi:hypothetical protein